MTYALQSTNSGSAAILPVPKTDSERKLMYNNEGSALGTRSSPEWATQNRRSRLVPPLQGNALLGLLGTQGVAAGLDYFRPSGVGRFVSSAERESPTEANGV